VVLAGTFTALGVPPANGFTQGIAYADNKVYACGTDGILTLMAGPLAAPAAGAR
jgi:hypothetical protein